MAAGRRRRAGGPGGGPATRPAREDSPLNLVWGLAALAVAGLLFGNAWRAWRRGRPEAAAAAIVAAGLVLRMYTGCDLFLHTWDERYHALVAKHLIEHPLVPTLYDQPVLPYDYRDWRSNHVWLHKPPLALWLMAAGMRLLGPDEIAMRLPSLLLSALAIFLTYLIGSHLGGRRVGLLAAAFQAINGYLLQLPGGRVAVDHVDNALIFFVELGILGAVLQVRSWRGGSGADRAASERRGPGATGGADGWPAFLLAALAIGTVCGLAVLTKWLPGLLPIPVWLALAWRRQPPRRLAAGLLAMAAACAAVALPWQLYIHEAFPLESRWESAYNLHHLRVPIEGLGGSPFYHLAKMPRFFGELIYLPVAWFLVSLVYPAWRPARRAGGQPPGGEGAVAARGGRRGLELLPLATWLLLPYAAFSLAATKLGGYVMVAAPALFIVEASFWLWLWDREPRRGLGAGGRTTAATALRWSALVLLPLLPLRYTVERMKIRPGYDRNPPWVRALRELPARLGSDPRPVVLFHLDRPLEAMFYTPYIAYEGLPTPPQVQRLTAAGYRVVVLAAAAAPPELRRVPGVELRPEAIPLSPLDDGTGFRLLRADGSDSPLTGTTSPP
jgi:4-amino-4-deoxy-L-arabinose transferase-like glycosyltransferase